MNSVFLDAKRVASIVQLEIAIVITLAVIATWVSYKVFLRQVSVERHRIFGRHFRSLFTHYIISAVLFGVYELFAWLLAGADGFTQINAYIGIATICWGWIVIIKFLRIVAYQYLFLTSMRVGVPVLLVNLLTLVLSAVAVAWVLKSVFQMDLTPVFATSAVLSIVIGIALQDTIGNLFAGVSLQFDKPFGLGDWIEVRKGSEKVVGMVEEVSWRATLLRAMSDELITVPNREMAQSNISNFAAHRFPFLRSHVFRIPLDASLDRVRAAIIEGARGVPGVLKSPEPLVLLTDTSESWLVFKLIYFINDYAGHIVIGDRVQEKIVLSLRAAGIPLAQSQLQVSKSQSRLSST